MSNIATTIEQSKHLLKLGLSKETSDMSYSEEYFGEDKDGNGVWRWKLNACKFVDIEGIIPAWSLSALLEVIPAMIVYPTWVDKRPTDVWFNLDKDYNSETKKQFYMCYYKSLDTHQLAKNTDPSHVSPIDAAYEMVCWLLEQELIKKRGQQ